MRSRQELNNTGVPLNMLVVSKQPMVVTVCSSPMVMQKVTQRDLSAFASSLAIKSARIKSVLLRCNSNDFLHNPRRESLALWAGMVGVFFEYIYMIKPFMV